MDLNGAGAIVTGGASGLGAATARALAEAGARVTILDRDAERGAVTAAAIGATFVLTDVTAEASAAAAVAAVDRRLDVLVNCAGIATGARVVGREGPHDLGLFRRTLDVNLTGTFNMIRLAAAAMARNAPGHDGARGAIVNTASIAAFDGQKGQAAYAASKAGVAGMTLPLARDLASHGIRVNAIAPGVFLTPMLEGLSTELQDGLAADVVFPRRLGKPEEYAELVLFLLRSDYLNGEVVRIDGALRMR